MYRNSFNMPTPDPGLYVVLKNIINKYGMKPMIWTNSNGRRVYSPKYINGEVIDELSNSIATQNRKEENPSRTAFAHPNSKHAMNTNNNNVTAHFNALLVDFDECNNASASSAI